MDGNDCKTTHFNLSAFYRDLHQRVVQPSAKFCGNCLCRFSIVQTKTPPRLLTAQIKKSPFICLQRSPTHRTPVSVHIPYWKALDGCVCMQYWPLSSGQRSFLDRCIQWDPSLSPKPRSKGNATYCAQTWCALQRTPSCCQICPFPNLEGIVSSIIQHLPNLASSLICEFEGLLYTPQMKQVVFRISSFLCFSLLKSAKVSMITPKMRLRTMKITTKKNSRS